MNEKFTKLVPVGFKDPLRNDKYQIIGGINRLGDLTNSINRDMENRILLVVSIIISTIIGFLVSKRYYLHSINIGIFLIIILILTLIKEARDKLKLRKMLLEAYNNALANGINLK